MTRKEQLISGLAELLKSRPEREVEIVAELVREFLSAVDDNAVSPPDCSPPR